MLPPADRRWVTYTFGGVASMIGDDLLGDGPSDNLVGATPEVWDAIHGNPGQDMASGAFPLVSAPERAMLRAVLAQCRLQKGDVVTELGCGTSRYLPYIAQRTGARVATEEERPIQPSIRGAPSEWLRRSTVPGYLDAPPAHTGWSGDRSRPARAWARSRTGGLACLDQRAVTTDLVSR